MKEKKTLANNSTAHHYLPGTEGIIAGNYSNGNLVFVISDNNIDDTIEIIRAFASHDNILPFPDYDVSPFERISPTADVISKRLGTLTKLCQGDGKYIVVTSPEALKRKTIPQEIIFDNFLCLEVGLKINRQTLLSRLVDFGYSKFVNACGPKEFAARGSVVDIVFGDGSKGYRIDFEGDRIESIRIYDTVEQKSLSKVSKVNVSPCDEIILTPGVLKNFTNVLRTTFGLKANSLIEVFSEQRRVPGQENLLSYFYQELGSLFDYITPDTIFLHQYDLKISLSEIDKNLDKLHQQRIEFKSKSNEIFFPTVPSLGLLFLDKESLLNKLANYRCIELNPFAQNKVFYPIANYYNSSKLNAVSAIQLLKEDCLKHNEIRFIIACYSFGSKQRLRSLLNEYDLNCHDIDNFNEPELNNQHNSIGLINITLASGFEYLKHDSTKIKLISEQELLGNKIKVKAKSKKVSKNVFTELSSFQEGQLVVHIEHGIGRFDGLQSMTVANIIHDFVKLTYADGDKFYLPVENLELISKFGSGDSTPLDKLGAASWQMRKAKLKNKIKIAAKALLEIAAKRALLQAPILVPIQEIYDEFCHDFGYIETEGQLQAIEDTVHDLAQGKPMDRLVCGDVGFGKTEVALRAALVAIANSPMHQVAALVPTTLLARQHFETFTKRFARIPIRIEQLSKFTLRNKTKEIKQDLGEGKVDIVIGTHALLAKDVKFKNLGLIIIDEEQHFGVAQKERLKEIKAHCHILTLSATPIPRTLHLSLTGIKDLSIITTPPADRLPIKTFVMAMDRLTIREAILREYYRSGRVFYVTPRVAYLQSIMDMIKEIVPEVKAQLAHGGMSATELDKIMNDFYDGKFSILVSTTIIESGLDISNANTIIVDNAHMFGLAQLYQIRGRVGRSNTQSFAYLTYPPTLKLSSIAEKRLQILGSFEDLGAGFSIASHDMDLRGYGNLVGDEQSGHVKEVGVELYQNMLEEAIENLKNDADFNSGHQASDVWSPTLNLKLSVQIPESFIPDASLRLSLYRRIANVDNVVDLEGFAVELIDRFGTMPLETQHLITTVKFKIFAKEAMVEKLDVGEKGTMISFKNNQPKYPRAVVNFINGNIGRAKMRPDNKLLIINEFNDESGMIKHIEHILTNLTID